MENIKEYEANWEEPKIPETKYIKVFIPEDSYNAQMKTIEVIQLPEFNNHENKVEKIAIICQINEIKDTELTHFLKPKINKGSTNKNGKIYSNSKLYDLLVDLGLREKFKTEVGQKFSAQKVADFLKKELEGKILRVAVKTSKANTPDQYSTISKILRIVPTQQ